MQVGERIKNIRKEHNLSKADFGKLIGISGQYIGMVEKGEHGLSVGSLSKICQITGISADYLLFGNDMPSCDFSNISELNGLSQEQIQIALDIIKKIASFINTENGNEVLIQEVMSQHNSFN